jgi:hypothetical protein
LASLGQLYVKNRAFLASVFDKRKKASPEVNLAKTGLFSGNKKLTNKMAEFRKAMA